MNIDTSMKKTIIFFCAAVLLGSCGIYGKYERPDDVVVADDLYGQPAADTSSIASLSWREVFTDPLLQQLIDKGLAGNTDLNVARLKVEQAEASLQASRLAYLPSLSLNPQANVKGGDGGAASMTYSMNVSSGWDVDIFGSLLNSGRKAQAALEQSQAYRQAVQTRLVATIANSYCSLLMLDSQLSILRRTLETWDESLRATKALKKAGMSTEMAVAQAEAKKLSAEASALSLEEQIKALENSLSALLGQVPGKIERSALDSQSFPDELAVGVPLQLLSRRPDVRQAEAALAAAFYATNEARSAFYPSVSLSGSAGWTSASGAAITDPGQWVTNAVGSLVQPLFSKGKNKANLKAAKAQQEAARLEFQQSLLDAGVEVNDALTQWQTAHRRRNLDEQQSHSLAKALESAELLMKHSSHNYLEVLSARQSLLQAELNVANDRFDEIQGVINLYHALGGGYDD